MTAPAPTRVEGAREDGRTAYETYCAGDRVWFRWVDLYETERAKWRRVECAVAARAEAEVARLKSAVEKAEQERADMLLKIKFFRAVVENRTADSNLYFSKRGASESSALALAERVAVLEAALKPFCFGDPTMEQILFGETPDDALCSFTIRYGHVRAARAALQGGENDR